MSSEGKEEGVVVSPTWDSNTEEDGRGEDGGGGADCWKPLEGVLYPSGHQCLISERDWPGDNSFKVPGEQGGWELFSLTGAVSF